MSCHEHTVLAPATVLNTEPGRALLEVSRQSACKACAERAQCGSQQETPHTQQLWLATETALKAGERVTVSVPETAVWHAATLAYGLPLAGFIGGLLAGALWGDVAALLGALFGLIAGFIAGGFMAAKRHPPLKILAAQAAPLPLLHTAKEES